MWQRRQFEYDSLGHISSAIDILVSVNVIYFLSKKDIRENTLDNPFMLHEMKLWKYIGSNCRYQMK